MRAGIALGSNLGDRLGNLKAARERLSQAAGVHSPVLASAAYETEPIGCEPGAPRFLNAVLEIDYNGEPLALLRQLREIEAALGRPAAHLQNTSRTIDLDLLYFGETEISRNELQLPHPRMHERRFVLEPLGQIRPELVLPRRRETVAELLRRLPDAPPLVRIASEW